MAAKTSWHRYGTKLRHSHPVYSRTRKRHTCSQTSGSVSEMVQERHVKPSYIHPFNGPFSGTTQVGRYQKGKTNLDFTEARDSECQWHQLGHMQVCTSLQTDNHTSTVEMPFL